ncbi:class I SAM-dependent methyltransferase [Pseudorhodoplanes sinuspersici]|nr:class I SAM-dependent methyltransferase [Pseudorhodoplanes sinuspersici]RKE72317.1 methyltransferase family protein [Pseudorhodoplanes sinuspersici]
MSVDQFQACEICGSSDWHATYRGPVRDGAFGRLTKPTVVARCGSCGVERLAEDTTKDENFYKGTDYRAALNEATDAAGFFAEHDRLQLQNLQQLWPETLRGKTIADIGCAAGSFLDHVKGLPARAIAVEPCIPYHQSLSDRGFEVYASPSDMGEAGTVDWAFSFSVIEHVSDPKSFLADIRSIVKPGGRVLISTPNRADVLMSLLPDTYPAFFYRAVHRWYFDVASLTRCAQSAGLEVEQMRCVHRFGISNALIWLRDKKPGGHKPLPNINAPLLDAVWARALELEGSGDYLYAVLVRKD